MRPFSMPVSPPTTAPRTNNGMLTLVSPALVFAILAFVMTGLLARLIPPFQVADEKKHYFYTRSIAGGHLLSLNSGGYIDTVDQQFANAFDGVRFHPDVKVTAAMFDMARVVGSGSEKFIPIQGATLYPPISYAIPALALRIADITHADRLSAFYVGRFANSLLYLIVSVLAIGMAAPSTRGAFCLILLLPMAASEAASFSPDGLVYSLSALICALLMREASHANATWWPLVFSAIALVIVSTTKLPLIALAIPLVWLAARRSVAAACSLGVAIVAATVSWAAIVFHPIAPDTAPLDQLSWLLHNPLEILHIAPHTLNAFWTSYFHGLVGIFGHLDTPLAGWFYWAAAVIIIASMVLTAVGAPTEAPRIPFLLACLTSILFTFAVLYLSWSPVGSPIVLGVQGRYFIPCMFPGVVALAGVLPNRVRLVGSMLPAILLTFISIYHVPIVIVKRFYLQ